MGLSTTGRFLYDASRGSGGGTSAVRLRALARPLHVLGRRSRERLARRWSAPGRRRARSPDHTAPKAASASSLSTRRSSRWCASCSGSSSICRRFMLSHRAIPFWPTRCASCRASARRSRPIPSRRSCRRSPHSRCRCYSAFAVRSRFIDRFGVPVEHAVAFPTRERVAAATEEELTELGFSRRKAEYVLGDCARRSRLRRARTCFPTMRSRRASRRFAGSASGARTGSSRGTWRDPRPGRPATSAYVRRCWRSTLRSTDVRAAGVRFHPFQNLSAHYLLAAMRHQ